jgi:AcrR family transcriptional regulator
MASTVPIASDVDQRSPRERRTAKTRRAIIDAARELFDQQGYNQTTIDQIAAHADIAQRTFFRYFPAKEALVFAEFEDLRDAMWSILAARPETEHPLRSLVAALADFAEIAGVNRERLVWGFRIADEHPQVHHLGVDTARSDSAVRMTNFVAERLGVDPAQDPRPAVWTQCLMVVFGASVRATIEDDEHTEGEARERFLQLYRETATALTTAIPG